MAWLDWFALGLFLFCLAQGIWRGLAQELIMLIGWLIVLIFSSSLAQILMPHLPFQDWAPFARQTLGFVLSVLTILILARALAWVAKRLLKWVGLGWLDHLLGAVFGAIRGLLILSLLIWVVNQTPFQHTESWQASQAVTIALRGLSVLETALPTDFGKFIASCAESLASLLTPLSIN